VYLAGWWPAAQMGSIRASFEKDVTHEVAGLGVLAIMSRNARVFSHMPNSFSNNSLQH